MDNIVIDNIQGQICRIYKAYSAHQEYPESVSESDNVSHIDMAASYNDRSFGDLADSGAD